MENVQRLRSYSKHQVGRTAHGDKTHVRREPTRSSGRASRLCGVCFLEYTCRKVRGHLVLATCLTSALAAPTLQWTPALGEYYTTVDRHIQAARQAGALNVPSCDMSKAVMPASTTPLPAPEEGWTLSEVVIGRGTQVCHPYPAQIIVSSDTCLDTPRLVCISCSLSCLPLERCVVTMLCDLYCLDPDV